jgi:aconitate hydratase
MKDKFINEFKHKGENYKFIDINRLTDINEEFKNFPYSIKILTENIVRNRFDYLENIINWHSTTDTEIPFYPGRALMHDFTGIPIVVDLVTMKDKLKELKFEPDIINPKIKVDLIIDHSIQSDFYGFKDAFKENLKNECERNKERYSLLKWAQKRFKNFNVVPPSFGICHQINMEYLSKLILYDKNDSNFIFPETVIGADAHTPMINGLGILGLGTGGIEVESVILGQAHFMKTPKVIGVNLKGYKQESVTSIDIALVLVEELRNYGVTDKFVEFFGEGLEHLTVYDKTTISNMSTEYGAMLSYFPVDSQTIDYFRITNRAEDAELIEKYFKFAGLYYDKSHKIIYSDVIDIDLSKIKTSVTYISTPHNIILLPEIKNTAKNILNIEESQEKKDEIVDGSVVLAAITSCRSTANIPMIVEAGLFAKKACERGLKIKSFVKTSFTPGSKSVESYLEKTGLKKYFENLNFFMEGFGCGICVGNSGKLNSEVEKNIIEKNLNVTAVLSGNHNLDAKIHPLIKSNFLTSPLLVIAYSIVGNINFDFINEPIGVDDNGNDIYLEELCPSKEDVEKLISLNISSEIFKNSYKNVYEGYEMWKDLAIMDGETFHWERESTYIRKPPFFDSFNLNEPELEDIENARIAAIFGDYVTTDNILPVGLIEENSPSAKYLKSEGITKENYNTYGSRRGNHEVMVRGIFEGPGINNLMVDKQGGYTIKYPENEINNIYYVCSDYADEGVSTVVFAGKKYGIGSSRDWAAKGVAMVGIKAIIAESFDRIHRNNLIGCGVLPLQFKENENAEKFNIKGSELISILNMKTMLPGSMIKVKVVKDNGETFIFEAKSRLDTEQDLEHYKHGGILHYTLRKLIKEHQ